MPTIVAVHAAIKSRLAANFTAIPLRYKNDRSNPMPARAAAFGVVTINTDAPEIVGFGGGRNGGNLQRTTGFVEVHILTPKGSGADEALTWGEAICAVFRGQRVDDISYFAAQAAETEGQSSDGNYNHVATATIEFHFDQAA